MLTTFDRYLLSRFAHVFGIFFLAAMGLYAVVDGFLHIDEFQRAAEENRTSIFALMGECYAYQSLAMFNLLGPTLAVFSVMCVLALLVRHGEIHPILAAGIPTMRLSIPFVIGVLAVNAVLSVNQEMVLPRIASYLQASHGDTAQDAQRVEPVYDPNGVFISGRELYLADQAIHGAEFRLPSPSFVEDFQSLHAAEALYVPATPSSPGGWLLKEVEPPIETVALSAMARRWIRSGPQPGSVFLQTDVTFDQLYNRSTSYKYLNTRELVRRIQRPTTGLLNARAQTCYLHGRLTAPILNIIGVFLVVPLVVRRERDSQVANIAMTMAALGIVSGAAQGVSMLGAAGFIAPDLATWLPLITAGSLAAWLASEVRT